MDRCFQGDGADVLGMLHLHKEGFQVFKPVIWPSGLCDDFNDVGSVCVEGSEGEEG